MPRYPRKNIKTEYLHIMTQGINKSYIFNNDEDIKYYIKLMYELKDEHKLNIIAYCIMNNHAHILVNIKDISELSKYMQRVNTKYGKFYNKKYNREGFVFRNRYKSEGIYTINHLYNCINYIYENPVKAGICKQASEYKYSNYKKINKEIEDKNYTFLEIDEDIEKNIDNLIKNYKTQHNLENIDELKNLIVELKEKYNCSFRRISEYLDINREKIRKIYNNWCQSSTSPLANFG